MYLGYQNLPRKERRLAKKLAKELLRDVPAAEKSVAPSSIRGAIHSAIQKPENLEAVMIYGDGEGHWWGDIVLKKKDGFEQIGQREDSPLKSPEEALEHVKSMVASLKANKEEHPIVKVLRAEGIDPEQCDLLRVRHDAFGYKYFVLNRNDGLEKNAEVFLQLLDGYWASKGEEEQLNGVNTLEFARQFIISQAPQFANDTSDLLYIFEAENGELKNTFKWLYAAASLLVANGIINIDQNIDVVTQATTFVPNSAPTGETLH